MEEKLKEPIEDTLVIPTGKGMLKVVIRNIWRKFGYYIFFFAVFIMYELLLRLASVQYIEFIGFSFAIVFNLILIYLFCYIMSFVSKRFRIIASNIMLVVATVLHIPDYLL